MIHIDDEVFESAKASYHRMNQIIASIKFCLIGLLTHEYGQVFQIAYQLSKLDAHLEEKCLQKDICL